jgi:hypothetical protein
MVLPAELASASYGLPLLDFARRSFSSVTLLSFKRRLFPDLSEDTVLVLAEGRGGEPTGVRHLDLDSAEALHHLEDERFSSGRLLDVSALVNGRERFAERFIPSSTKRLYRELIKARLATPLRDLAEIGIGYVTGSNRFFHMTDATARAFDVPKHQRERAVLRGRSLKGLTITESDWADALQHGQAAWLLRLQETDDFGEGVRAYLDQGRAEGVPAAYKCRTRRPWYSVPGVYRPDAFLTYMSGHAPLLVANEAGAVAPNSLHVVRFRPGIAHSGRSLAALWCTSLSSLSAELEGHSLGGGMLKLEPREAQRAVVANIGDPRTLEPLADELDGLIRRGLGHAARSVADRAILRESMGLSEGDVSALRSATDSLRSRRTSR